MIYLHVNGALKAIQYIADDDLSIVSITQEKFEQLTEDWGSYEATLISYTSDGAAVFSVHGTEYTMDNYELSPAVEGRWE